MNRENISGVWTATGKNQDGYILELKLFLDGAEFSTPDPRKTFRVKQEFEHSYLISSETLNNKHLFPRFFLVTKYGKT